MRSATDSSPDLLPSRVHALEGEPPVPARSALLIAAIRLAADAATALAALSISHVVLLALGLNGRAFHLDLVLALAAITCATIAALGGYRAQEGPSHVAAATTAVSASLYAVIALAGLSPLYEDAGPFPETVLADLLALWVGLVGVRAFLEPLEHRLSAPLSKRVLIYGAGTTGRLLAQRLLHETGLELEPIGFVDDDPGLAGADVRVGEGERGARLPVLATGQNLGEVIDRARCDAVFIAIPSIGSERIAAIARSIESRRCPVSFVPSTGDRPFASLRMASVGGIPMLAPRRTARRAAYLAAKRILDVVLSGALLVAGAPFLLAAIALVRLTSPGPALFRQERVGLGGRRFTIYKLRTMFVESDPYAYHPQKDDDGRVTPVGRWLRRTSLDELPQLWNILAGEMSFVGPRPEMPFIVAGYDDTQLQRLLVKPGLTGLWQVSPDRAFKIHDNIQHDLYYVENRSLAMDLAILILTPFQLLSQRAAR